MISISAYGRFKQHAKAKVERRVIEVHSGITTPAEREATIAYLKDKYGKDVKLEESGELAGE